MLDLFEERDDKDEAYEPMRIADLDREATTRRSVGRFTRAMGIVVAMLLLFNSNGLVEIVNGFGVGPAQDAAVALAETWNEQMEKNGLTRVGATIRAAVERARDASWSELTPSPRDGASMLRGPLAEQNG